MHRFLSVAIPLSLCFLGVCICLSIRLLFSLPTLNVFESIGAALFLGVMEIQLLRRLDEEKRSLLLLDGMVFPFFSLGIAAGTLL
jgi:hypothetical protein